MRSGRQNVFSSGKTCNDLEFEIENKLNDSDPVSYYARDGIFLLKTIETRGHENVYQEDNEVTFS